MHFIFIDARFARVSCVCLHGLPKGEGMVGLCLWLPVLQPGLSAAPPSVPQHYDMHIYYAYQIYLATNGIIVNSVADGPGD